MGQLVFKNGDEEIVLVLTEDVVNILDPKEGALALFEHCFKPKSVKSTAHLYGGGFKALLRVDKEKIVQLEPGVSEPHNWEEFVSHFARLVKNIAFM